MNRLIILLLICCPSILHSQKRFIVRDNVSLQPIEFASIKAFGRDLVIFSDPNGEFSIPNQIGKIFISHTSYITDTIYLNQLTSNVIFLRRKTILLDDVIVTSKDYKSKKKNIGITSTTFIAEHQLSTGLSHTFILKNTISEQTVLNNISFYLRNVTLNKFTIDLEIKPIGFMTFKNISYHSIKFRRKKGWLKIDLSDKNIPVLGDLLIIFRFSENISDDEKEGGGVFIGISDKYVEKVSLICAENTDWLYFDDYFYSLIPSENPKNYIIKAEIEGNL